MNALFDHPPQSRRIEYPPRTLTEFRATEPDAAPWANLEWGFVLFLIIASDQRRMIAGPKGLMHEAARTWMKFAMREFTKIRLNNGSLVLWDASMIEHLVGELADEMANSAKLKAETLDVLKRYRDLVWTDGHALQGDQYLSVGWQDEDPYRTFTRTLDYIEHMGLTNSYAKLIDLRRFSYSCVRVAAAVFVNKY